jgi:murein DD-endopeptidase MepM/ murein hydrolase activator NlpD
VVELNTAPTGWTAKLTRKSAHIFRERELLLRSEGRVRFVRLTRRLQICAVSLVAAIMLWGAAATTVSWLEYDELSDADARLKNARIAYDDLLEEIAIYQRKVSEVTGKLKQNQAELVGRFAHADAIGAQHKSDDAMDADASDRLAAITESRDAMRQHLNQLDQELREMTDLDNVLAESLNSIQHDLVKAVAERKKVYQARANLNKQVQTLQGMQQTSKRRIAGLESNISELTSALSGARSETERVNTARDGLASRQREMQDTLAVAAAREAELVRKSASLRTELNEARADYERISGERAKLEVESAALQGSLRAEEERANQLESDLRIVATRLGDETGDPGTYNPAKESLSEKVASLLDRLTKIHLARSQVIETLNALTVGDIEGAERILGMTGLDVDSLLAKVGSVQQLGKGGPFVALAGGVANDSLAGAVQGLDTQLGRLEALKVALQAVPLVSPVDTYRVASGFGKRRDPMSKKWAAHSGVDLASRNKTMIYSSAPGIVTKAGWSGRYGRLIEIDHGFGIRTRYGHLRKILVKKGQSVRHRDKIALLGSSGRSTGPHLHYEILYGTIALDPMRFIQAGKHVFKE